MANNIKGNTYHNYLANKRKAVFKELNKNSLLTPKQLCKIFNVDYETEHKYLKYLKTQWKRNYQNEQGSIRSFPTEYHNVFYKSKLPVEVVSHVRSLLDEVWDRAGADRWVFPEKPQTKTGWHRTKAKNRYLLYKGSLGRIRFFETGTVEIFVKKPANLGKCKQLFSNAFTIHYLIENLRVVDSFFAGLMRRCHMTYKMNQRLPYVKITSFERTHGLTVVLGDKSHPDSVEFLLEYNAEVEQARRLFDTMNDAFGNKNSVVKPKRLDQDYSL